MSKPKKVALYARVSTDGQTTENQLRQPRAVAEHHGWTVAAEHVNHGVSGAKGRHERPQFDAVLCGVARREVDMIAEHFAQRLVGPHDPPVRADHQAAERCRFEQQFDHHVIGPAGIRS